MLFNMYLRQSKASVYTAAFLFMFIHKLINSATGVYAVIMISILCVASTQYIFGMLVKHGFTFQ